MVPLHILQSFFPSCRSTKWLILNEADGCQKISDKKLPIFVKGRADILWTFPALGFRDFQSGYLHHGLVYNKHYFRSKEYDSDAQCVFCLIITAISED
jgi:hypothetical protein